MAVMNRTTRPLLPPLAAFLLAALCLLSPRSADALSVSKSLPLYARDMEFYYQNKRPEVLPGILRSFDGQGVLAQGEKRLMVAAFLAEVLRDDPSARSLLLPPQAGAEPRRQAYPGLGGASGRDARRNGPAGRTAQPG